VLGSRNSLIQVGEVSWDVPVGPDSYRVLLTLERDAESVSRNSCTVQTRADSGAAED